MICCRGLDDLHFEATLIPIHAKLTVMKTHSIALTLPLATCLATNVSAAKPTSEPFGKTSDGTPVELYTLKSEKGLVAKVMTRGATLVQLHVPDANGKTADVILGFDDVSGYEGDTNQYFGCTTGRVCNRIAKGKFTVDGVEYNVAVKNGPVGNHRRGSTVWIRRASIQIPTATGP